MKKQVIKAALLVGSLNFLILGLSRPVLANELWVAPAAEGIGKKVGDYGAAAGDTRFRISVPHNNTAFVGAEVEGIGTKAKEIYYDVNLSVSEDGLPHTHDTATQRGMPAPLNKHDRLGKEKTENDPGGRLQAGVDEVRVKFKEREPHAAPEKRNRRLVGGPAGPAGPQIDPAREKTDPGILVPLENGFWNDVRTETCPGFHVCTYFTSCFLFNTAISGMCGDAGSAINVKVVYSGIYPDDASFWMCRVNNDGSHDRTINLGAFCVF